MPERGAELNGITNLTNWMGNVIMPTVAGLFFALAVIRYARGYPYHQRRRRNLTLLKNSRVPRSRRQDSRHPEAHPHRHGPPKARPAGLARPVDGEQQTAMNEVIAHTWSDL